MTPVIDGGDIVESLGDRVLGRIVAKDVMKPGTDDEIAIDRRHAARRALDPSPRGAGYRRDRGAFADHL
jgi:hypothetical protein